MIIFGIDYSANLVYKRLENNENAPLNSPEPKLTNLNVFYCQKPKEISVYNHRRLTGAANISETGTSVFVGILC